MNRVIKYSPQNDNHIIVSTFESINVYDLRHNSSKISKQFKIDFLPENDFKSEELDLNHIQCFDFNCDYNYLVAGTELCEDKNVYLYFWDIRKPAAVLGAYYESHTNDITDIAFHPNRRNIFATGSSDQLINIFDMNETQEDDALITTLNIESAVEKINWTQTHDKHLFCITQDECIQLWNYEEVVPKVSLSALSSNSMFDYVVDVLRKDDLICVGDKNGSIMMFDINSNDNHNEIHFKEHLTKGHNKIVRTVCSASDDTINDTIFSGGEDGIICFWNNSLESSNSLIHKNQTKGKPKMKRTDKKRQNPY
jgi:WD40 repeat protein